MKKARLVRAFFVPVANFSLPSILLGNSFRQSEGGGESR